MAPSSLIQSNIRMPKTERELRQDIVEIGRLVFQKGWVAANDGNISVRLDETRILCTPTGVSKGMMHVDDLIICDMKGNKIEGRKERTSESTTRTTTVCSTPAMAGTTWQCPSPCTLLEDTDAYSDSRHSAA